MTTASKGVAQRKTVGAGVTQHTPILTGITGSSQQLLIILLVQPIAVPQEHLRTIRGPEASPAVDQRVALDDLEKKALAEAIQFDKRVNETNDGTSPVPFVLGCLG